MVHSRWYTSVGLLAAGLLFAATAGCQDPARDTTEQATGSDWVRPESLADQVTPLPPHVHLPGGYYPLAGHYNPENEADQYNGWPRYIVGEQDGMILCYVPSMQMVMGGGIGPDEVPARTIVVNHFYMDLHEVTNAQFNRFYHQTGQTSVGSDGRPGYVAYYIPGLNDDHPVRNVTWVEADGYARWSQRQLPTEAQWEAAARGDDHRIYPWGNEERINTTRYLCNAMTGRQDFDGYEYTAPVLSYAAGVSPYGIYNLSGNVGEWCSDWYDPGRYAYPTVEDLATGLVRGPKPFGDENYPNPMAKEIPASRVGPRLGSKHPIRGGSWAQPIQMCRTDSRDAMGPDVRRADVGFRCVLPLPPEEEELQSAEQAQSEVNPADSTEHTEPGKEPEIMSEPEVGGDEAPNQ
jgi:iron(II)-dependent oxidoreductase